MVSYFKCLIQLGDTNVDNAHYDSLVFKEKEVMAYLQASWINKCD